MRKLIEFQILDKNAEEYDVDLALLMNEAGFSVAKHIINNYDVDKIITIVCGSGNNGGDGFVAANILIERGFKVNLLISASPKSKISKKAYSSLQCEVCHLDNLSDFKEDTDILLDCLLGSGLKGEVRPPLDQYIVSMNEFSKIISVDVPSGIGTSCSIVPDSTVTFHDHKSILNESNSGEIILVDIGFPKIVDNLTGPGELLLFPNLDGRKHKGQNGKVAIVGGGAFSGKDPTKVDRSAAYAARYIAKNVVASKIADKCLIQLAYAIGVSKPLSIYVDLFDNNLDKNKFVVDKINENFDLSPRGIREMLNLNKPIYEKTAAYGHFGRTPEDNGSFSWEKTDKTSHFSK